jgi:hypothetical protein
MELKARKKPQAPAPIPVVKPRPPKAPKKTEHYRYMVTIQCNTMLYNTIQNMLAASHTAQDFTYTSIADLIRAALAAYRDGMPLTELEEKGQKLTTTIRVDRTIKEFYSSLPDRMRVKLLERTLRSFLKQHR